MKNPSTDGICAWEDPCNISLMLHKNGVPSIGRFSHYLYLWSLPYLMKTAPPSLLLHPVVQSTSPAHSAFLTRLHLPALWSSSWHHAEPTQAHQHLSCRGPPEPEEIFHMWWVVSAELVGNKHFPWPTNSTWPVCVKSYHNLCLPKTAWIAVHCRFFFAKPGEEYMLKQKYVHCRVKCPPPVSKTQKLFNFWQTLLIKYNLWRNRFALFYFGNASSKKFLFKKR